MITPSKLHRLAFVVLPLGCAAEPDSTASADSPACRGSKCDEADGTSACKVNDLSDGFSSGEADVLNHGDPLAAAIFKKGDTCPSTFAEMIAKLDEFDADDCNTRTMLVNETAQVVDEATHDYRSVTTRDCRTRARRPTGSPSSTWSRMR